VAGCQLMALQFKYKKAVQKEQLFLFCINLKMSYLSSDKKVIHNFIHRVIHNLFC